MDAEPTQVIASIEKVIEAVRVLRLEVEIGEEVLHRAAVHLREGHGIAGTLEDVPVLETRRATDAAVTGIYEAMHDLREVVIEAGLAEGMAPARLAEAYGVPLATVIRHGNTSLRRA